MRKHTGEQPYKCGVCNKGTMKFSLFIFMQQNEVYMCVSMCVCVDKGIGTLKEKHNRL